MVNTSATANMKNPEREPSPLKLLSNLVLPKDRLQQHFLAATVPPILLAGILYTLQHGADSKVSSASKISLIAPRDEGQCRIESSISDTCSFVKHNCPDFDDDGLIPYFSMYYCVSMAARPYLLGGMLVWLLVLFAAMATAAGDFLSVNLAVIVSTLGISESLAGVTIFAFGNGSSDLFSTLAAMNSNSGSLAISELFGAAAFITTVVLGMVAFTQPFSVDPNTFIGEVVWFILLASCLTAFLADGQLVLGECLGIIGLYLAFISYAVLRPKRTPNDNVPHVLGERIRRVHTGHDMSHDLDETTGLLAPVEHDFTAALSGQGQSESVQTDEASTPNHIMDDRCADDTSLELDAKDPDAPGQFSTLLQSPGASATPWSYFIRMFPPLCSWKEQSKGERVLNLFSILLLLPIGLTTSIAQDAEEQAVDVKQEGSPSTSEHAVAEEDDDDDRSSSVSQDLPDQPDDTPSWPLYLQILCGPQLLSFIFVSQTSILEPTTTNFQLASLATFLVSAATIVLLSALGPRLRPRLKAPGNLLNAIFGFTVSLTWIYLTATSAVSLLKTLGFILKIPNAVLGAVIFAVGNSSNDLVANTAVARRGFPVLAASACFGGPMMNMLLGIGGGGLVQVLKQRDVGGAGRSYSFDISPGLFVSVANLLGGLAVTLIYAFCNSWRLDRRLGLGLIGIWGVFTLGNVVVSTLEA